jgi:cell cycle protein kinase DBF2/cell cycle protein kinase DBF20
MTLMNGIFSRPQKEDTSYVDDLSKDVESLNFGTPSTPRRNNNYNNNNGDGSFMQICSPERSPQHSYYARNNKENTPGNSPTKLQLTNNSSNLLQNSRLNREFYTKANSAKTKRLITVCQMYFLDYYCDMFDYVISRQQRIRQVENSLKNLSDEQALPQWRSYTGRERAFLRKRRIKPKNKDFDIITQVGQGGYGQVFLARNKDTKEICALKVLNKKLLTRSDETKHVLTERDILTNTRSEWLVKLLYAFQDAENLYMAMEFVPGGDFRTLLNNAGYLNAHHARFYISEMFAAVNALHQLGFTHRDLKPENFLIDAKGHIKLTDFGLAAGAVSSDRIESMKLRLNQVKDLEYKPKERSFTERQQLYRSLRAKDIHYANSMVGSPDYMALEVLEGKPYDYTVDYWSLGCMLFETIVGYTPFCGGSSDETYGNLKRWKHVLKRPRYEDGKYVFSDRTWQLITKLIASPNDRLRSFKQIIEMPYFSEIQNWETLRDSIPPFIPQLDNEEDAGYFDDFENESDMAKYKDVIAKREQDVFNAQNSVRVDAKNFVGFTFKHKGNPSKNPNNILAPIMINKGNTERNPYIRYNSPFSTLY